MKSQCKILMIDCSEKHRQVVRHFLSKMHPTIELVEHDPCAEGMTSDIFIWSNYALLIIDNQLGDHDGQAFVKKHIKDKQFPPVLFLSSLPDPGSANATKKVIEAIQMGAESFLFKKNIDVKQFSDSLTSMLERTGYDPDMTQSINISLPEHIVRPAKTEVGVTQQINQVMQDTVHEMELALAMIHGHAEWPFTMRDILAGNARIGSYKITSYLGKGNNTSTFKGRGLKDNAEAIVKLVSNTADADSAVYKQSLRILKQVLMFEHENLASILEYKAMDKQLMIAQEFIHGENLSDYMKRVGRPSDSELKKICLGMLAALQKLHEFNLVVESISPSGIILKDNVTPVFTNYGIIKRLHALNQVTGHSGLGAEAAYVSPEKISKLRTDSRTDIYMLGTIFYELLAGHPPYYRGSVQDILYAHIAEPVPLLPDSKHPMNKVIQGMIEKTPSRRIQTTQEVIDMVNESLS